MKQDIYYSNKLDEGNEYQDFIMDKLIDQGIYLQFYTSRSKQFKAETRQGIEIKYDNRIKDKGNIYLEYKEKKDNSNVWVNSGFMKEDNTWLIIIGDYKHCFFFFKDSLKELRKKLISASPELGESNIFNYNGNTSQAICLPINDPLMKVYCGRKIIF